MAYLVLFGELLALWVASAFALLAVYALTVETMAYLRSGSRTRSVRQARTRQHGRTGNRVV